MDDVHNFYRDPEVIKRILEYCGVPASATQYFSHEINARELANSHNFFELTKQMTAEYVAGVGPWVKQIKGKSKATSRRPKHLGELLDHDLNLFRSVWDKKSIIFFFDVEYTSGKFPGEAYANPKRVFDLLEPVYWTIFDIFKENNITPLTLSSGQGYHFVFKVDSYNDLNDVTQTAEKLSKVGHVESTLEGKYSNIPLGEKRVRTVSLELGKAFDTAGKLLEFVVHETIRRADRYGVKLPIGVGDLNPGNQMQEGVNLDLSTWIEPINTRVMRTAFSIHDKNKSVDGVSHYPIQIEIPRYTPCNNYTLPLNEIHKNRRHFQNAANYAKAITTEIPECSNGVERLLNAYVKSGLYAFHVNFDQTQEDKPTGWSESYDKFDLRNVPPCVAEIIQHPNPALLQPQHLQTLVRVLTGKTWWHPKHVAGLIRSKYERDHRWTYNWGRYDANTHACGWTRIYGGMLSTGVDARIDQNCVSHQERGLCTGSNCGYNLGDYK
jgi:hypothetical protein